MVLSPDNRRFPSRARETAPILITDGGKGGVGKSFLSRLLAYLLSTNTYAWRGFDLDPFNGHLERFHRGMDVARLDWTELTTWDKLLGNLMDVEPSRAVLIDTPAQAGKALKHQYPRLLATAQHLNRPLLRFWTLTSGYDSVNLLAHSLTAVPLSDTFAVINLRDSNRDAFKLWTKGDTRKDFLAGGGTELCVPQLSSGVANAIEDADLSFCEARSNLKEPWYQYDIEAYLRQIEIELAPVVGRLA